MKPIFHKDLESGRYFKFVPESNISQSDWDSVLDVISTKHSEFVTEGEFNKQYKKTMTVEVKDKNSKYKIGELTTKWYSNMQLGFDKHADF